MAYKFNPFTGNLDLIETTAAAAGADTQVQYNNGGSLAGSADLTWDDTAKELGVGGDINLDDGGTYETTLQAVTPTANRTISFPDATGTVALVSGADGTVQYNEAGVLKGNSDFTVDPDWNDAAVTFTGLKLNVTNTASASGSNLLDLQVGGTSKAKIDASGDYYGDLYSFLGETNRVSIRYGSTRLLTIDQTASSPGARVGSSGAFAWSKLANSEGNPDLSLYRDAANTLAQRNGTNAQTYRLYNTYTDASNYERGFFQWNSNVLEIGSEGAGTGSEQPVRITAATLKLPNLPTYADNAAATTGGLVAGDVYKTATGELRITV